MGGCKEHLRSRYDKAITAGGPIPTAADPRMRQYRASTFEYIFLTLIPGGSKTDASWVGPGQNKRGMTFKCGMLNITETKLSESSNDVGSMLRVRRCTTPRQKLKPRGLQNSRARWLSLALCCTCSGKGDIRSQAFLRKSCPPSTGGQSPD